MANASHFVLVEGVNVYDTMYDTGQLSIIRGTSALYKQAITDVASLFSSKEQQDVGLLDAIATGASSGLFLVKEGEAVAIANRLTSYLESDINFQHLRFQVEWCTAESLAAARNQLYTQLRISQLQNFTSQPDYQGEGYDAFGESVCELEGRRIVSAGRQNKVQSEISRHLSASVFARLKFGREQRQAFYQSSLKEQRVLERLNGDVRFADNFVDLCEDKNKQYGNLANKMAVIYIDGNNFGKCQQDYIEKEKEHEVYEVQAQQAFDQAIQGLRATFLASEVERELDHLGQDNIIPLETLMWGGDEMLFVMPAWSGFDFIQRFFEANWLLQGEVFSRELTHAAGVVFCQASTPIRVIQSLAHELAENVKESSERKVNGWDYLVLESVDYPTSNDLSKYFEQRYGEDLGGQRTGYLPSVADWVSLRSEFAKAKSHGALKTSQLYHVVNAALKTNHRELEVLQSEGTDVSWPVAGLDAEAVTCGQLLAEQRLFEVSDCQQWLLDELPMIAEKIFAINNINDPLQRSWLWLHLVELWDYLAPESEVSA